MCCAAAREEGGFEAGVERERGREAGLLFVLGTPGLLRGARQLRAEAAVVLALLAGEPCLEGLDARGLVLADEQVDELEAPRALPETTDKVGPLAPVGLGRGHLRLPLLLLELGEVRELHGHGPTLARRGLQGRDLLRELRALQLLLLLLLALAALRLQQLHPTLVPLLCLLLAALLLLCERVPEHEDPRPEN